MFKTIFNSIDIWRTAWLDINFLVCIFFLECFVNATLLSDLFQAGEDSWESLGRQRDPTSPFWRRSALGVLWKNDAKAETLVLWPPRVKSWLTGKDPDAGKDWGQKKKGTTEDEMAGWHHWLNGHEFEWTLGDGDGQVGQVCCDSWGLKESDTTEWLNWTELNIGLILYPYKMLTILF